MNEEKHNGTRKPGQKPARVWKPLDYMGLRLYRVTTQWPPLADGQQGRHRTSSVFADKPSSAAAAVAAQYEDLPEDQRPLCQGYVLNVYQPAEWTEDDCAVRSTRCEHKNSTCLGSSDSTCDGHYSRESAWLCLDCGELHVSATKDGVHVDVRFGLACDQHLRAAARYMRSEAGAKEAVEVARRGVVGEVS
jgi:hypothetical protein